MSEDEDLEDQVGTQPEGWSSESNDCFHITFIRPDGEVHAAFQPSFTYPIFGEQEAIFGYRDLSIELTFAAHSLEPRLNISYGAVYEAQGDIKPTDIKTAIAGFLPAEAFLDTDFSSQDAQNYTPPGERVRSYKRNGQQYEVFCASLANADAKQLLERMQILIPLFIEGGTMLQLEQDWTTQRWKLYTLWLVQSPSQYSLVGYGTSYRVFTLPQRGTTDIDALAKASHSPEPDFLPNGAAQTYAVQSPLELSSRERLSQFLIIPDYQGSGHGQELYRAMYTSLTAPSNVREFTVEDPNESFDDLRDLCDLTYLRARQTEFAGLEINTDIPAEALGSAKIIPTDLIVSKDVRERIRAESKVERRQFDRLVEMQTLSKIPVLHRSRNRITRREKTSNKYDKQYYFWRLYVKQRLLIFNEDALMQLDREERIEKLEAAVDSNQEYFVSMIEQAQKREAEGIEIDGDGPATSNGGSKVNKKRKVIDDDEDDDDDAMSIGSKRSKVV